MDIICTLIFDTVFRCKVHTAEQLACWSQLLTLETKTIEVFLGQWELTEPPIICLQFCPRMFGTSDRRRFYEEMRRRKNKQVNIAYYWFDWWYCYQSWSAHVSTGGNAAIQGVRCGKTLRIDQAVIFLEIRKGIGQAVCVFSWIWAVFSAGWSTVRG